MDEPRWGKRETRKQKHYPRTLANSGSQERHCQHLKTHHSANTVGFCHNMTSLKWFCARFISFPPISLQQNENNYKIN